jgi:conjugative transfer signal peptidase TraF
VLIAGALVLLAGQRALSGRLLINYTPSIPQGIYWVSPGAAPERGDLVAFPIPENVRELLYERGYIPRSIQLLAKPVAAVGGDRVCISEHRLLVNGEVAGTVLDVDRRGRAMPRYAGCGVLPSGALFVTTGHDNSFDSRNFGPIDTSVVRGTLTIILEF